MDYKTAKILSKIKEIKEYNPDAKIIIMLRNPIDFLHSLHSQLLFSGNEDEPDFEIAMELEEERMKGNKLPENIDMITLTQWDTQNQWQQMSFRIM